MLRDQRHVVSELYSGDVIEYLIRHEEHVNNFLEPYIAGDRFTEVFRPPDGLGCEATDTWTVLQCGDTQVAIALEGVGIQVSFDGPIEAEKAERIVAALVAQVQQEVDEPVVAVQISWS